MLAALNARLAFGMSAYHGAPAVLRKLRLGGARAVFIMAPDMCRRRRARRDKIGTRQWRKYAYIVAAARDLRRPEIRGNGPQPVSATEIIKRLRKIKLSLRHHQRRAVMKSRREACPWGIVKYYVISSRPRRAIGVDGVPYDRPYVWQ